jgi:hypothetical protein
LLLLLVAVAQEAGGRRAAALVDHAHANLQLVGFAHAAAFPLLELSFNYFLNAKLGENLQKECQSFQLSPEHGILRLKKKSINNSINHEKCPNDNLISSAFFSCSSPWTRPIMSSCSSLNKITLTQLSIINTKTPHFFLFLYRTAAALFLSRMVIRRSSGGISLEKALYYMKELSNANAHLMADRLPRPPRVELTWLSALLSERWN